MNPLIRNGAVAAIALLVFGSAVACHKEEQAVEGVTRSAVKAEHRAQAQASERDREQAKLARIPVPTKSLYVNVHDARKWQNPFLTVGVKTLDLRIEVPNAGKNGPGKGTAPRARRQDLEVSLKELGKAVAAIPPEEWPYGRVIAVAESPKASRKEMPEVRRNVEAVINELNDLGVVVEEWPSQ